MPDGIFSRLFTAKSNPGSQRLHVHALAIRVRHSLPILGDLPRIMSFISISAACVARSCGRARQFPNRADDLIELTHDFCRRTRDLFELTCYFSDLAHDLPCRALDFIRPRTSFSFADV
jgi:hypothetical protein